MHIRTFINTCNEVWLNRGIRVLGEALWTHAYTLLLYISSKFILIKGSLFITWSTCNTYMFFSCTDLFINRQKRHKSKHNSIQLLWPNTIQQFTVNKHNSIELNCTNTIQYCYCEQTQFSIGIVSNTIAWFIHQTLPNVIAIYDNTALTS